MRRGFSIFLILFFGLGPLSVFIDGEEANLPACCRRHGAHHCAMAMQMTAMMRDAAAGKMPLAEAPMTCPHYPGLGALLAPRTPALTASAAALPAAQKRTGIAAGRCAAPESAPALIHAGRGPPAANLI